MKKFIGLTVGFLASMPIFVLAQQGPELTNVEQFFTSIGRIIRTLLPILVGLALLGFFWGLAKFIFSAGNEDAQKEGKKLMIWGLIALFIMVSVWGLVGFIGRALGIQQGTGSGTIPTVTGLPTS